MSKTECIRGHSYAEYGRYEGVPGKSGGVCKECKRIKNAEKAARAGGWNKRGRKARTAAPEFVPKAMDVLALEDRIAREMRADLRKVLEAELAKLVSPNKKGAGA